MVQAEYEKEMARIEEEYEQRLMNIDAYIDRFARIDLSDLSDEESKAIRLFQEGDIDGAIKVYEDMKLEEKYKQTVDNRNTATQAKDSVNVLIRLHEEKRDTISSTIQRRDNMRKQIGK